MSSAPVVELTNVVTLLGRFPALSGVHFAAAAGEIVLVKGPNGAGKTTLLRVCAGLLPIESGHGTVAGHDLGSSKRKVRESVGYVAHETGLYPDLSVAENIDFWARASCVAKGDMTSAAERFGLNGRLADVAVARLSAGQKRRVGLALLVAKRRPIWLLDEPHASLDEATRDQLDQVIKQAAAGGTCVIIASHELERATGLATRTVELVGGHAPDHLRPSDPTEALEAANG